MPPSGLGVSLVVAYCVIAYECISVTYSGMPTFDVRLAWDSANFWLCKKCVFTFLIVYETNPYEICKEGNIRMRKGRRDVRLSIRESWQLSLLLLIPETCFFAVVLILFAGDYIMFLMYLVCITLLCYCQTGQLYRGYVCREGWQEHRRPKNGKT